MFRSTHARELFVDWEDQARTVVENLRSTPATIHDDPAATALVEELSMASSNPEPGGMTTVFTNAPTG